MSRKEKLIEQLGAGQGSITFDEAESLLGYLGYDKNDKGRTSGSRVMFVNRNTGDKILLHRPHPQKELRDYQMRQVREHLIQEGLL